MNTSNSLATLRVCLILFSVPEKSGCTVDIQRPGCIFRDRCVVNWSLETVRAPRSLQEILLQVAGGGGFGINFFLTCWSVLQLCYFLSSTPFLSPRTGNLGASGLPAPSLPAPCPRPRPQTIHLCIESQQPMATSVSKVKVFKIFFWRI